MKDENRSKKELIEELQGLRQRSAEQARELLRLRQSVLDKESAFAILQNLPVFAYIQAPDHTIRYANNFFKKQYGEPGKMPCYEVIWGRKEPCEECPTFRVFETGRPEVWESVHADGRSHMVYDYLIEDKDGSPLVLEMSIDTTEVRRIEREKNKVQSELFQLQKMEAVGNIAGGLARDIRNKITLVKALVGRGQKVLSKEEPRDAYIGLILSAVEGVLDLTQRLTVFSRKKGSDPDILIDLNEMVGEVLNSLGPVMDGDIQLDVELEAGLKPVIADKLGMEQALDS